MKYHKELTLEKWQKLPKHIQILNIGAEISRLQSWQNIKERKKSKECVERAMELLNLTLEDKRWKNKRRDLLRMKEALGYFYLYSVPSIVTKIFYDWSMQLAQEEKPSNQ